MSLHRRPSTYVGFASWGTAAFMAQPTMASFIAHFGINAGLIAVAIWLARHGR